jgi:DNA-binding response OmpR family regulator
MAGVAQACRLGALPNLEAAGNDRGREQLLGIAACTRGVGLSTVALIDPNPISRAELAELLRAGGYGVSVFAHWREARAALLSGPVDAVVLCDWRRLGGRGSHRYLWKAAGVAPFILVCDGGVTRWDDRFTAVLYHPVTGEDLFRAIEGAIVGATQSLTLGGFRLDLRRRSLTYHDADLRLTPIETSLLRELMLSQGRFADSWDLMSRAWGIETLVDRRVLYTHVAWLRRKLLRAFGSDAMLVSSRGQGYRFDPSRVPGAAYPTAG